jgi:protein-L-isoaspartate(D-aspartate) O-methyltransferase
MISDRERSGIGMTSARTRERLIERLKEEGITSEAVLNRIREVPRHLFVDEALSSRAYEDTALPIGHGQTISQPYVVARMTEAVIAGGRPSRVLEIGTGCGYQTAILAGLAGTVYSVERVGPLLRRARERLGRLGIRNVRFRHSDGWEGWKSHAPYDAIIVTAAPPETPKALMAQLADGGRLIIPVGPRSHQELLAITRRDDQFEEELIDHVIFVPLLPGMD